jgi:hypothetical protein
MKKLPVLKTAMTPFPYSVDACRSFGEYLHVHFPQPTDDTVA